MSSETLTDAIPEDHDRKHAAVLIRHGDLCEWIDIPLAELIKEIWKAGINTFMSCQDTFDSKAWIEFDSADDAKRFLNLIVQYEPKPDSLYARMQCFAEASGTADCWSYQWNLWDALEDQPEQHEFAMAEFCDSVGVYFPPSDIAICLERMREHNELMANLSAAE